MERLGLPRVGMRTVKTALAVAICVLLFQGLTWCVRFIPERNDILFQALRFFLERPNPIFACIAAVIAMQPTVGNSLTLGNSRILGTAIGGAYGLLFLWLDNSILQRRLNLIFVVAGMVLVIQTCLLFKHKLSVPIALVTFLILMITLTESSPYLYAINRILDTAVGIGVSLGVNLLVSRPKTEQEENP